MSAANDKSAFRHRRNQKTVRVIRKENARNGIDRSSAPRNGRRSATTVDQRTASLTENCDQPIREVARERTGILSDFPCPTSGMAASNRPLIYDRKRYRPL